MHLDHIDSNGGSARFDIYREAQLYAQYLHFLIIGISAGSVACHTVIGDITSLRQVGTKRISIAAK